MQLARNDLDQLEAQHVQFVARRCGRDHHVRLDVNIEARVRIADGLNDFKQETEEGALVPCATATALVRDHVVCDD